jgi:hypothetical protein
MHVIKLEGRRHDHEPGTWAGSIEDGQ